MRLSLLTDELYIARLNVAVAEFERRCHDIYPKGITGRIYQAFVRSTRPLSYWEVMEQLQLDRKRMRTWHSRIQYLYQRGWLKSAGRAPSRYRNMRGAMQYLAAEGGMVARHRFQLAADAFKKQIDHLNTRRARVGCLSNFVQAHLFNLSPRQEQILRQRAAGMTLSEVGQQLGLTRERIRQLEDQAILKA